MKKRQLQDVSQHRAGENSHETSAIFARFEIGRARVGKHKEIV